MCHHIHRYKLIGLFQSRNSQLPFADSGLLQIHSPTVVFGQALQPPPFLFPCISASWQLPPRRPLSKSGIVHPPKHPSTQSLTSLLPEAQVHRPLDRHQQ